MTVEGTPDLRDGAGADVTSRSTWRGIDRFYPPDVDQHRSRDTTDDIDVGGTGRTTGAPMDLDIAARLSSNSCWPRQLFSGLRCRSSSKGGSRYADRGQNRHVDEGRPRLTDVVTFGGKSESDLLRFAASLERGSEHPLAEAIVEGAKERGHELTKTEDFSAVTGKGVRGRVGGRTLALGNPAVMRELGLVTSDTDETADALRAEGKTAMYVAIDGNPPGLRRVSL